MSLLLTACAYESSGTTTTTFVDPLLIPPPTGPADLVFRDQATDGAVVVVESVTLPAAGFVVLLGDDAGAPGEVIGITDLLSAGVIANVPVAFFVPLESATVVHAQLHVDMDRDGVFTYEPPDAFVDVPAVAANGEVAGDRAVVTMLPPVAPAAFTFFEQRTTGDSVVVDRVELPAPGFIVVREDDLGSPGRVLGTSGLLPAGLSRDVEVALDSPLGISAILHVALYVDRDEDGVLLLGEGAVDRIAQGEDGADVVLAVAVTVVPLRPVRLAATDQETEGDEVRATVTVPGPAFLVARADDDGSPGRLLGVSLLLDIGTNDVLITLDPALEADTRVWLIVHIDLDGDGEFDETDPIGILEAGGEARISIRLTLPEPEEEEE